ncbi:MAG: agmatinase [Candidatus Odinarchaeota archaeon]
MNNNDFFGATVGKLTRSNMTVIGIPWDVSSSYRMGASKGPTSIRQATSSKLYNPYAETGIDLRDKWQIFDAGDVNFTSNDAVDAQNMVFDIVKDTCAKGNVNKFLFLGGDHLITFFCFQALIRGGLVNGEKTGIIYLDAHPDLYDELEGDKYSHACVLRRIIDQTDLQPSNIVQVGIRAPTPQQLDFAGKTGIKIISTKEFQEKGPAEIAVALKDYFLAKIESVYLSIDLDVLDPSFAPGIGNPQPGGLTTREIIDFIHGLAGITIYAMDIVELCTDYDHSGITAYAAAKLIQETLGIM